MNWEKKIKNSFVFGLVTGLISLGIFYFMFSWIRTWISNYFGNPYMLRPPAVQLLTLLINIILFRLLMINFNKEQTGKGFLFITVIFALLYFFIFFRMNK